MKIVIFSMLVMIGFSACSGKKVNHNGSYDRANTASEKAQNKLEKD